MYDELAIDHLSMWLDSIYMFLQNIYIYMYLSYSRWSFVLSQHSVVTIPMKAIEQKMHVPVVLFIMLYKVVLTFESMGKILKHDH